MNVKERVSRLGVLISLVVMCVYGSNERTGWGFGGVPAINYNADDGFGCGVVLNFFYYSRGGYRPYYFQLKPIIFFTTGGKQDHSLFFDSPYVLGKGLRINFLVKYLKENYYPYYGPGNSSEFCSEYVEVDKDGNPLDTLHGRHYYNFQTEQIRTILNLQKKIYEEGGRKIFVLGGCGLFKARNSYCKNNGIKTLLQKDVENGVIDPEDIKAGVNSFLKLGIVYDSRDNEPAPNKGVWFEVLIETYLKALGSYKSYYRLTITDRGYFQLSKKLVYAQRVLFEKAGKEAPFYMLYPIGGSFRSDEGLGGYRTIRGVLKNRYLGRTKFLANFELRYRFYETEVKGQDVYLAFNIFYDVGRVWWDKNDRGFGNLHAGKGGGLHIGLNENFIVYAEMGFSREAGGQLYLDLGYLF